MNETLRKVVKTWVPAPLVSVVRGYFRYFPLHIGKRQLRAPLSLFWHAPREFVATTLFQARMPGNTRDFIDRRIYYFGVWEPNVTAFINRRLAPGDLFVDVGASTGYYSLLGSRLVGESGAGVAIEASPSIHRILCQNLALNRIGNIRTVNVAAADRPGTLRFYLGSADNRGVSTILEGEGKTLEGEVPALPLDEILHADEIATARFIKIDVEGAEALVVEGMGALLESGRDDLEVVIEVAPRRIERAGSSAEKIFDRFRAAGFKAYTLLNDYSLPNYLPPRAVQPPRRLRGPIRTQTDIVFSRVDADQL